MDRILHDSWPFNTAERHFVVDAFLKGLLLVDDRARQLDELKGTQPSPMARKATTPGFDRAKEKFDSSRRSEGSFIRSRHPEGKSGRCTNPINSRLEGRFNKARQEGGKHDPFSEWWRESPSAAVAEYLETTRFVTMEGVRAWTFLSPASTLRVIKVSASLLLNLALAQQLT